MGMAVLLADSRLLFLLQSEQIVFYWESDSIFRIKCVTVTHKYMYLYIYIYIWCAYVSMNAKMMCIFGNYNKNSETLKWAIFHSFLLWKRSRIYLGYQYHISFHFSLYVYMLIIEYIKINIFRFIHTSPRCSPPEPLVLLCLPTPAAERVMECV